jgi:pSer/pThr/pTyr-binding forkhead associated (FHA) protein
VSSGDNQFCAACGARLNHSAEPSANKAELPAWLRKPGTPEPPAKVETTAGGHRQRMIPLPIRESAPAKPEPTAASTPTPVMPGRVLDLPDPVRPRVSIVPTNISPPQIDTPSKSLQAPPTNKVPEELERPTGKLKSIRTGKVYNLDKQINTMGRRSPTEGIEPDIDCTAMDDDFFCSRRHARVLVQDGTYLAEDLGSANGSYLNNNPLAPNQPTPLHEGDRVRLGNVEFVFTLGVDSKRTGTPSDPFVHAPREGRADSNTPRPAEGETGVKVLRVETHLMEKHLRTAVHRSRDFEVGGWQVAVDLSSQVVGLHMPDEPRADQPLLSRLPPLSFLSTSILSCKAHAFNEGLLAAVEMAAQAGFGDFPGKAHLVKSLTRILANQPYSEMGNIPEVVFGASLLGGVDGEAPPQRLLTTIMGRISEESNKPVEFFTRTRELEATYKQDRMLESPLSGSQAVHALVRMMANTTGVRDSYEACLALIHGLAGPAPSYQPDLGSLFTRLDEGHLDAEKVTASILPPRSRHADFLARRLLGDRPGVELPQLLDELMREMRAARTVLTPDANACWYDYVNWALEALVSPERMPEAHQLHQADSYRRQLHEVFKEQLWLAREAPGRVPDTHATPATPHGPASIVIEPAISVEPTASFYLRLAVGYRFLRLLLDSLFGAAGMSAMRRLDPQGRSVEQHVGEELMFIESLFYGAHVVTCQELGLSTETALPVGSGEGPEVDASRFLIWSRQLDTDIDIGSDLRQMVPVGFDKTKTRVWMHLGWASRPIRFYFFEQPITQVSDKSTRQPADGTTVQFQEVQHQLWYPVTAIALVDKVLPPDQFRHLCDATPNAAAIVAAVSR